MHGLFVISFVSLLTLVHLYDMFVFFLRWSKSATGNGLAQSERLFKKMVKMYEGGNAAVRPNHITYITLVNAIVRSQEGDCAERAENLVFQMYEQFKDGNKSMKPNSKTIAMVVDSWHRSGKPNAGERAEALLDWMIDINKNNTDAAFAPNEYIFSSGTHLVVSLILLHLPEKLRPIQVFLI